MVSVLCKIPGVATVFMIPTSVPPAKRSSSRFSFFIGVGIMVSVFFLLALVLWFLYCLAWGIHSVHDVQVLPTVYLCLQQPAPLQGLPLHLVNGIDCENDLRNSGGLRCWLRLFSVQLCNYAVKHGYPGGNFHLKVGGGGGGGGPKAVAMLVTLCWGLQ